MNVKDVLGLLLNVLTLLCYAADQKSKLTYDTCEGDKCYAFVSDKKNWTEARDFCNENKGFLAEPMNPQENYKVSRVRQRHQAWLGGNDLEQEGDWKWDFSGKQIRKSCTGTVSGCFEKWEGVEPNDGGNPGSRSENCLVYLDANAFWWDNTCDYPLSFVCQKHICDGFRFGPDCEDCTCIASNTEYCDVISGICNCKDRWTGDNCQTPPSDPCVPHPCGQGSCTNGTCDYCSPDRCKGGSCIPKPEPENFTCECDDGYDGQYCEITDDPCKHDQNAKLCKNGGTCIVKVQPGKNDWICICPGKPVIGQAKDCSDIDSKDAKYPISPVAMAAAVSIPFSALFLFCLVFCVYECYKTGELPTVRWAKVGSFLSFTTCTSNSETKSGSKGSSATRKMSVQDNKSKQSKHSESDEISEGGQNFRDDISIFDDLKQTFLKPIEMFRRQSRQSNKSQARSDTIELDGTVSSKYSITNSSIADTKSVFSQKSNAYSFKSNLSSHVYDSYSNRPSIKQDEGTSSNIGNDETQLS